MVDADRDETASKLIEYGRRCGIIAKANELLELERKTGVLVSDIRFNPPDIWGVYGPTDMTFSYSHEFECTTSQIGGGHYYLDKKDAERVAKEMNARFPMDWKWRQYDPYKVSVETMTDHKLKKILMNAAKRERDQQEREQMEKQAKEGENKKEEEEEPTPKKAKGGTSWRERYGPVVNAMTGETVYPEDCTCNFGGRCHTYCNLYE